MYMPIIIAEHKNRTKKAHPIAISPSLVNRNNKPSVMPNRIPVNSQYFSRNTFQSHFEDFAIKEKADNMLFLTSSSLMLGFLNSNVTLEGFCLVPQ